MWSARSHARTNVRVRVCANIEQDLPEIRHIMDVNCKLMIRGCVRRQKGKCLFIQLHVSTHARTVRVRKKRNILRKNCIR